MWHCRGVPCVRIFRARGINTIACIVVMLAPGCSQHKVVAQVAAKQQSPQTDQEARETYTPIDAENGKRQPDPAAPLPQSDLAEGPPDLKPLSNAAINIRMSNDATAVYDTLGKLAGLTVILDPDFPARRTTVDLTDATIAQPLDRASLQATAC